jgi:uncharacterized protein (DUF2384 family)
MKTKRDKAAIFVDLDGTLVWTWTPLITTAFMSAVFGLPLSTPPKPEDGYRKLVKVPIRDQYSLTCRRPKIGLFLRDLRAVAEVRLLTHANRDYALAMNQAFRLGFAEGQIFSKVRGHQGLDLPKGNYVLIDDEAVASYYSGGWTRHREKCRALNLEVNSSRVVAVTPFAGRQDDPFVRPAVPRAILYRARIALNLNPGDQQRAAVYAHVLAEADSVIGSEKLAHDWIATPQRALGMRTPLSKFNSNKGVSTVIELLKKIGSDSGKIQDDFPPKSLFDGPIA